MNELLKKINDMTEVEDIKLSDMESLEKDLSNNGFDTYDIHDLICCIRVRYKDFMKDLNEKLSDLTDEQIETIDVLKRNNILFEVKKEHDWCTQTDLFKIEINWLDKNREEV